MTNNGDKKDKKNDDITKHDFDGIKEEDNPIPWWFQLLLYGTIGFAAIYMYYYHIYKDGQALKNEYLASVGTPVQPVGNGAGFDYVGSLKNAQIVASGKQIYDSNCGACHGMQGQGVVGPNLTDDYWISGDTYQDVQKAIEVGVVEKGMPAWKDILGQKKIQELVVYIASLQGTNPQNAKAAEGKPGKLH